MLCWGLLAFKNLNYGFSSNPSLGLVTQKQRLSLSQQEVQRVRRAIVQKNGLKSITFLWAQARTL